MHAKEESLGVTICSAPLQAGRVGNDTGPTGILSTVCPTDCVAQEYVCFHSLPLSHPEGFSVTFLSQKVLDRLPHEPAAGLEHFGLKRFANTFSVRPACWAWKCCQERSLDASVDEMGKPLFAGDPGSPIHALTHPARDGSSSRSHSLPISGPVDWEVVANDAVASVSVTKLVVTTHQVLHLFFPVLLPFKKS